MTWWFVVVAWLLCAPAASAKTIPRASADATSKILLTSNETAVWYVDGVRVGRGKGVWVLVNKKEHEIVAEAEGYVPKLVVIHPPYRADFPYRITFLIGDQERFANPPPPEPAPPAERTVSAPPPALPPAAPVPPPPAAPATSTDGSNDWAVVIGVERYRDGLPPAVAAEADARAFAAYAERTLGIPRTHIQLLVGERAARGDIISVLEEWLPKNATVPGGKVYFYFSGHGAPQPETGRAYLMPYDSDPAYLKTRGIETAAVYETLSRLPGQTGIVLLDACFTGSGVRSALAPGLRPLVPVEATAPVGTLLALTAAGPGQTTGLAADGTHGVFTHYLLEALHTGGDADGDGQITLAEVAEYVAPRVLRDAHLENREQKPQLSVGPGVDPAEVVVVRVP